MAKKNLKLDNSAISSAKPGLKPYKMADGGGLYLLVNPNGSRYWRQKYRLAGKEKLLALGVFPRVGLADARKAAEKAREHLQADRDPAQHREEIKQIAGATPRQAKASRQSPKLQSQSDEPLKTDSWYAFSLNNPLKSEVEDGLKALLPQVTQEQFDAFFDDVRKQTDAYRAHQGARAEIARAQKQERYFRKLENTIGRFINLAGELSILLERAPFELKRKAAEANVSVHSLQKQLSQIPHLLNDFEPSKSKFRPERAHLARMVALAYEEHLGVQPVVKAFREKEDVPESLETAASFTPVLALLLNSAMDTAYRIAKSVFS